MNPIKKFRILAGKSITEAAKESGICANTIRRWEEGKVPRLDKLKPLAKVYGIPLEEILAVYVTAK